MTQRRPSGVKVNPDRFRWPVVDGTSRLKSSLTLGRGCSTIVYLFTIVWTDYLDGLSGRLIWTNPDYRLGEINLERFGETEELAPKC